MIIQNDKGEDVEVFTAEDVAAREATTRTAVENEWKPKVQAEVDLRTAAEKRADDKAVQLSQQRTTFEKLSEEQLTKLSDAERIIYNNQKIMADSAEREAATAKTAKENAVAAAIRAKVGTDQKLFDKAKDMYAILGLDDSSQEGIEKRVIASLGALGSTEPDLLAGAGFSGGSFVPPVEVKKDGDKTFADSDQGKAGAAELGIILEAPKKN